MISFKFCFADEYDNWRQRLRGRLYAELDQRVRRAVQTPPRERLRRRSQTVQDQSDESSSAQQIRMRQLVNKMNEMAGATRKVQLVDVPPKPMFCNTVDLRLHPETHQWRRRWNRDSPPVIKRTEQTNRRPVSSDDEKTSADHSRWIQQSLKKWLDRSQVVDRDSVSEVIIISLPTT
ncbi:unnamed protein product [Echinostoma caproni]|uniref:NT-3 n=1 Tax=Echinostoma caproni TaxID=27848 RepID=A0A183AF01_9TREM|nr:unnamed protein product [Echinostoma caproni]